MMNHEHDLYKKAALGILPNPDTARMHILQEAKKETRLIKKSKWIGPAIACACAALVICTAIPSVRAAVVDFFRSVGSYMSASSEERPQVEDVFVQTVDGENPKVEMVAQGTTDAAITGDISGDAQWRSRVKVTLNEALYDGETLYLTYTVDGSEIGLLHFRNIGGMPSGDDATAPILTNTNIRFDDGIEIWGYDHQIEGENGVYTITTEFSDNVNNRAPDVTRHMKGLSGDQNLSLILCLAGGVSEPDKVDSEDYTGHFNQDGILVVPFTFNAANEMTVLDAQTYVINGYEATLDSVNIKPTEISIDLSIAYNQEQQAGEVSGDPLAAFAIGLNFKMYADGVQLTDGFDGNGDYMEYMGNSDSTSYVGRLVIPFPDQDWSVLTLVPYDAITGEEYNSESIEIPLDDA